MSFYGHFPSDHTEGVFAVGHLWRGSIGRGADRSPQDGGCPANGVGTGFIRSRTDGNRIAA